MARNEVKLLTLYSVNDRQPVAFAKQPGNVPDVISIQNAIRQLQCFDIDKPVVVTDNGFYSQANMAEFARNSMKFLTLASPSTLWIREIVDELRDRLDSVSSVCSFDTSVHCASKMVMKELSVVRQRSRGGIAAGEAETFSRRLYVHVCYSRDRATKDEQRLVNDLFELKRLVEAGEQLSPAGEKKAEKFLHCSTVGRGGKLKVAFRDEAFREARKYFGFFALVSNEVKDAEEALKSYRLREKIEELFNVQRMAWTGAAHASGTLTAFRAGSSCSLSRSATTATSPSGLARSRSGSARKRMGRRRRARSGSQSQEMA